MKTNKIALVTGGSRGLGKEMSLQLIAKGIDVVITYHQNREAADTVVADIEKKGLKAKALQLDTCDISCFKQFTNDLSSYLISEYGQPEFDFLINNAGTGIYQPFLETTEAQFDAMVNVHFKGVYFLTQQLVPLLKDGGRIINISSGLTRFTFPNSSAYAAAKGAVEVFTKFLAKELAPRKIIANVVAPGGVATDFGGGENKNNEQKRTMLASATALGRVGEADDIGGVVSFLCSDDAKWINGQRIEVSGGVLL
ncbi:NAD(P)-dependent dehydrogenase (short-subunit alcohol dehydrogenase family) [Wenyingzhuangia heitensis]|uniref:NAD(P)-dependent dehydrogenase (Short-subunit alcohol dehydrogenase family) n=1 Tax=Wenyingzhuangia heitensis TaxID=1487859 RepID=A0ABX0UGR5_9FLAO|nr:SDR family oxidoreductase [Wenyingzhuangia heitensis]NIJ46202.1 NAD(P)-dependent dehydrogenase (short-subunit alcohol dehydrogenase family) [Wenyingzhuangia heitensis]